MCLGFALFFEPGSCFLAQADLDLEILLPQLPGHWITGVDRRPGLHGLECIHSLLCSPTVLLFGGETPRLMCLLSVCLAFISYARVHSDCQVQANFLDCQEEGLIIDLS